MTEGTKELMDVIAAVEKTAEAVRAAKADGTINWLDLPKLGQPVVAWKDALVGFGKIKDEIRDLDHEELPQVLTAAIAAIQKLGEALLQPAS